MELSKQAQDYAMRVAELVKFLREDSKNFPLSDALLSCAVEAGMALRAQVKDRNRAAEAVRKADYLLEMAVCAGYLTKQQSIHISDEGRALLKTLESSKD